MKTWKPFLTGFVGRGVLIACGPVFAVDTLEYKLTKVWYAVPLDGTEYRSEDLPILNYSGHLRAAAVEKLINP